MGKHDGAGIMLCLMMQWYKTLMEALFVLSFNHEYVHIKATQNNNTTTQVVRRQTIFSTMKSYIYIPQPVYIGVAATFKTFNTNLSFQLTRV